MYTNLEQEDNKIYQTTKKHNSRSSSLEPPLRKVQFNDVEEKLSQNSDLNVDEYYEKTEEATKKK